MSEQSEQARRLDTIEDLLREIKRHQTIFEDETRTNLHRQQQATDAAVEGNKLMVAQFNIILKALQGDLANPEVPGLIARMVQLQNQYQQQEVALAEFKRGLAEASRLAKAYQDSMPSAVDLVQLSSAVKEHDSKWSYVLGWAGGLTLAVLVFKWLLEMFVSVKKP